MVKAQKISNARKDLKEFCNMIDILEHAAAFGAAFDSAEEEPLDEEWAMFFYDRAKNVSRDGAKVLWGKILAEECRAPGTIPKHLVLVLSLMSKEDADLFSKICRFCVNRYENGERVETNLLVFYNDKSGLVNDLRVNSLEVLSLETLGLISIKDDAILLLDSDEDCAEFEYHGKRIRICRRENNSVVELGEVTLTNSGQVLADMIHVEPLPEFMEYVSAYYESRGYELDIV